MPSSLPAALRIYRRLSAAAGPLTPALIKRRLKQGKEDPARIAERWGIAHQPRPAGPLVWIHGASVGEVLAAAALIERLRALDIRILLTSGTVTSAAVVAKRFPPDIIHQYLPYDSPRFVARFLDHWQPSLALFIESDLWPNLILAGAARRLPMVVINGRMSQRSFPRWQKLHGTISALLGRFDICLVQSEVDAERFSALGSRNVIVTGNLKLDVQAPPADDARLERLMSVTRGRPVVVAASTHPGEEEMLLHAHRTLAPHFPSLLTVIVPRHPNRGEAIARAMTASGAEVALRSLEELPTARTDIYVADTMGELGLFYRLAPIVFMGGSLVPHGGQNPIEAIKLDASIVHGPHVFNFTDVYDALDRAGGARQADDGNALVKQLGHLLNDPAARNASA
ncbi:MAG: 3-deoxy-D-manno-octulosonic acid transferase, partial [Nitrobacter sp.]